MKKKLLRFSRQFLILITIYFAMFLIIFFSSELSSGIKNGINVSINLVIPSMFIFMIFSNVIINSKLKYSISRPFKFLSKYVFRISENNIAIVILSLVGGYPVGAKLINNAVNQNSLSQDEASNLLCYCVNCGPAFLISGIGVSIFSNFKIGLYMYLSQIIACVATGFIMSFFNKDCIKNHISKTNFQSTSYSVLFVKSVNDSVKSMTMICGFIVAFSAFMPMVSIMLTYLGSEYSYIVQGFLEVTTGCNNLSAISSPNAILLATAFTAFGGVCVHLQVYAMISSNGVKMTKFFILRVIYTLISVLAMKAFLILSPATINCINYNANIKQDIYSVSPTATIFMILLAIMLLFFTKKSDRINIRNNKG
ncbi:MAG: hypothetical protein WAX04_02720 [Oscillospiraceae bacterium]